LEKIIKFGKTKLRKPYNSTPTKFSTSTIRETISDRFFSLMKTTNTLFGK